MLDRLTFTSEIDINVYFTILDLIREGKKLTKKDNLLKFLDKTMVGR